MTIPTLVNNYQKKILHTKFQKAYAVLNEVNTRMMADGIYQYNDFLTVIGSEEARIKQLDTFASYLNGATVCNDKYIICSGVKKSDSNKPEKNYHTLDGSDNAHIAPDAYTKKTIIANDGMLIWAGGLQFGWDTYYVDTNGYKQGPNKLGYDLFRFIVNKDGTITPEKDDGSTNRCSFIQPAHGTRYLGFGCGYYAWKNINPDDPTKNYWDDFLR